MSDKLPSDSSFNAAPETVPLVGGRVGDELPTGWFEVDTPGGRQRYYKKRAAASVTPPTTSCAGCADCTIQASGGVWTCEDGASVYVAKSSYYGVLVSDPNFVLPYWARPQDLGV